MTVRVNPYKVAPDAMKPLAALDAAVAARARDAGLEPALVDLVKLRASQLNGCAFCIHLHSREARARGESEERLWLLEAWRESPLYSDRERAALAWTEALTLVGETQAPDAVYEEAQSAFGEVALVQLSLLIATINAWNRIGVGFRMRHPVRRAAAA